MAVDILIALIVLGLGIAEVASGQLHGPWWACMGAVLALASGVLLRRAHTWVAVVLAFAANRCRMPRALTRATSWPPSSAR